jgi:hypothetical protein
MIVWDESVPDCGLNVPPADRTHAIIDIVKSYASPPYTVCAQYVEMLFPAQLPCCPIHLREGMLAADNARHFSHETASCFPGNAVSLPVNISSWAREYTSPPKV